MENTQGKKGKLGGQAQAIRKRWHKGQREDKGKNKDRVKQVQG